MRVQTVPLQGEESKQVTLPDSVFKRESKNSAYYTIKAELANRRVGTAAVKNRSRVRGGGKKPWRQKGLGRARAGSIRSPLWRGGGVIFGPAPRDYSIRVPVKQRRAAMMELLSQKVADKALQIVPEFSVPSGKTKDAAELLRAVVQKNKVLLIMSEDDAMTKRALRNIPWLRYNVYKRLSAHQLAYADTVLLMDTAVKKLAALLEASS